MQVRRFPQSVLALAVISWLATSAHAENPPDVAPPPLGDPPAASLVAPPLVRTQLRHHDLQYSGVVVEYAPEQSISLQLESGEIKRFPWSEVQQITGFEPARASAGARPLVLPKQVTTPEGAEDLRLSQRKKTTERDHVGFFISGGIITAAGVAMLVGGLALAFNQEPNRESHAFLGTLGIATTVLGSSQIILGSIFLGVGGYRQAHANDPIEPE